MNKQQIAEFVRHIIEHTQSFAQSLRIPKWRHRFQSDFDGIRKQELFKTAQILLATATASTVIFSIILIKSMGFTVESNPKLNGDLSQAGFSFAEPAEASESSSPLATAELHLHKGSYWVIQSLGDMSSAEKLVALCAERGLKAHYYQVVIDGANYFRVLLSNRYENNAEAKQSREMLPEQFQEGSWVVDIEEAVVVWN